MAFIVLHSRESGIVRGPVPCALAVSDRPADAVTPAQRFAPVATALSIAFCVAFMITRLEFVAPDTAST